MDELKQISEEDFLKSIPRASVTLEPERTKGPGFLGALERPGGGVSTELSIGVDIDGKETEIPTLVPTLTKGEVNYLLGGNKPTGEIINKVVTHAKKRISVGQSPFLQQGENAPKYQIKPEPSPLLRDAEPSPYFDILGVQPIMEATRRGLIDKEKIQHALSFALTFDIPVWQAYQFHDELAKQFNAHKEFEGLPLSQKVGKSFVAGMGNAYVLGGRALQWMGIPGHETYIDFGERLRHGYVPSLKPEGLTWENAKNPEWWAVTLTNALPVTLSLIPPAIVGAYGISIAGGALGLGTFGRIVLASIGATALRRPLESAYEAGGGYEDALKKGRSEERASSEATQIFWHNMALSGLDVAELALAFTPLRIMGKSAQKTLIRRILATSARLTGVGVMEAGEEAYQDVVQRMAAGEKVAFDPRMKESAAIGMVFGLGLGGVGSVYTALTNRIKNKMPFDLSEQFSTLIEEKLEGGATQEEAELSTLDAIAETPEGKEHIEKVVTELKDIAEGKEPVEPVAPKEEVVKPEPKVEAEEGVLLKEPTEVAKEPWEMTKAEIEQWEFSVLEGGGSKTPKTVFEWRKTKDEFETLYDLSTYADEWSFNESLGKGWEKEWKSSLNLKDRIKNDKLITIYRASEEGKIIPGSYVSESLEYVKKHQRDIMGKAGKIYSDKVKPSELMIYGDPHEFIYVPESAKSYHKAQIKQALSEGKPVPEAVLKDYPDLRPKPEPTLPTGELPSEPDTTFDFGANIGEGEVTKETISLDFKDHAEGYVAALADLVEMGEPGKRTAEGAWKSAYPEFMRDKGWTKQEVMAALKKATEKKKLTPKQEDIVSAALKEAQEWFVSDMQQAGIPNVEIEKALKAGYEKYNLPVPRKRELSEMFKKAKIPIKRIIREQTGQVKLGDLIREEVALKAAMMKAAQAARKAMSEGRKEGVAKERARLKMLDMARKERQETRNHIKKLAKQISKPASLGIDFYYREAIENLQVGIDPSFRQAKTLKNRERTRQFLASNPEKLKDMPIKLLKTLEKKSLNDYTISELEEIAREVERLRNIGKLKRTLRLNQKTREREKARDEIVETIMEGKPLEEIKEPIIRSTVKEDVLQKAIRGFRAITLRPSRIADKLDKMQDFEGPAHKFFIDEANDAVDEQLRAEDIRRDKIEAKRESLGITVADLAGNRTIEGIDYTLDELLDIYVGEMNARKKLAIIYGNNIRIDTEELLNKIANSLTKEEKEFAQAILSDYQENTSRLRESVIENENRDMGYEENYTPIRRTEIDYKTMTEEVIDEILHRTHLKKGYTEKGMTVARKDIPEEFQRPIRLGIYSMWLEQVNKQESYIHLTGLVKDMHRMLDDPIFKQALEQSGVGKEYHRALRNYVGRVANPNIYRSFNAIENLSRTLRRNVALYYLAGNLVTMGKQLPSVLFYLPDAGVEALTASLIEFAENPIKMMKMVREKDPQVKHRSLERELEELKALSGGTYAQIKKKVGETGMAGIYLIDRTAITIGWNAVYKKNLSIVGEEGAVKKARNVTLRTQPQAKAKDLPDVYATNEFMNWFLQFTNQLNQIYNIATHDIPSYMKNENYGKAALASSALAMSAIVIWTMTKKRLPEKLEDIKEAFSDQAINAIPIIGKTITSATRGWSSEIPAFKGIGQIGSGLLADKKKMAKRVRAILEGMGLLLGAPGIAVKRTYKFLETGKPLELLGPKPKK